MQAAYIYWINSFPSSENIADDMVKPEHILLKDLKKQN